VTLRTVLCVARDKVKKTPVNYIKGGDGTGAQAVPAGTTFPAVSRDPCDLLMRSTFQSEHFAASQGSAMYRQDDLLDVGLLPAG
jgi:hypothetical protein